MTVLMLLSLTLTGALLGQAVESPPALDVRAVSDAVVVALLPVLVWAVRQAIPRLPRALIWTLPIVFGTLTTMIASALDAGISGWRGIILGGLAIALREMVSTLKEHGLTGKGA